MEMLLTEIMENFGQWSGGNNYVSVAMTMTDSQHSNVLYNMYFFLEIDTGPPTGRRLRECAHA